MSIQSIREKINLSLYDSKESVLRLFKIGSFIIASIILSLLVYQFGFSLDQETKDWIIIAIKASFIFYILKYFIDILYSYKIYTFFKETWFEGLLLFLIIINAISRSFLDKSILFWVGQQLELFLLENFYILFIQFYFFVLVGIELGKASNKLSLIKLNPPQLLILSFVILIFAGTGLLMMPEMTKEVDYMPFFEALFTSISASCVTGLIVVDTATYFTQKGHTILMLLIQLGGLNIISFATLFAIFSKKGLGIKHQTMIQENFSSDSLLSGKGLLRKIFMFSFLMEVLGTILLYFSWSPKIKFPHLQEQFFYSLFHSVSAFNNAGFSLFSDGLSNHLIHNSYGMHLIIAGLIFFGSIGFPVIQDLFNLERIKKSLKTPWSGLKLSTRISFYTALILIAFGILMFYFLEQQNSLNGMKIEGQLITSLFPEFSSELHAVKSIKNISLSKFFIIIRNLCLCYLSIKFLS